MKAQAAFEYMLIVMIVMAFLVPLWTYTIVVNNEAADELALAYAKNAAESLTSAADLVYSQGPPAKVRINVFIPGGVNETSITNQTVILNMMHSGGITSIFSISRARLNGTIPSTKGMYRMEVRAVYNANYDIDIQRA